MLCRGLFKKDLSKKESVNVDDLKNMPCILITSKEQQKSEREFYQQVLGFGGNFIYAQTLDEGQLMVRVIVDLCLLNVSAHFGI